MFSVTTITGQTSGIRHMATGANDACARVVTVWRTILNLPCLKANLQVDKIPEAFDGAFSSACLLHCPWTCGAATLILDL